jgi:hypothetical protein
MLLHLVAAGDQGHKASEMRKCSRIRLPASLIPPDKGCMMASDCLISKVTLSRALSA